MHLTERFTRVSPDVIQYEFTVDDPTAFTKPWTARIPLNKTAEPVYEYACHEGNYALTDILAGARAAEKKKVAHASAHSVGCARLASQWLPARRNRRQPPPDNRICKASGATPTITPLERPADLAGKATFTAEEAAAYEKQVVERSNVDHRDRERRSGRG